MMSVFAVLGVIFFLILAFSAIRANSPKANERREIHKLIEGNTFKIEALDEHGGLQDMKMIYGILISKILHDPQAKIFYNKGNVIKLGLKTPHTSAEFIFLDKMENKQLEITWNADLGMIYGKKSKTWKFPRNQSQEQMFNTLMQDIKTVFSEMYR